MEAFLNENKEFPLRKKFNSLWQVYCIPKVVFFCQLYPIFTPFILYSSTQRKTFQQTLTRISRKKILFQKVQSDKQIIKLHIKTPLVQTKIFLNSEFWIKLQKNYDYDYIELKILQKPWFFRYTLYKIHNMYQYQSYFQSTRKAVFSYFFFHKI